MMFKGQSHTILYDFDPFKLAFFCSGIFIACTFTGH